MPTSLALSPTAPATPRTELTSRHKLIVSQDPWATKVKADAALERQELEAARLRSHTARERHRQELEAQIQRHEALKAEETARKKNEILEVNSLFRDYLHSREAEKREAKDKHAAIAAMREEQLRQIAVRRQEEKTAMELEAARLREETLDIMKQDRERLRLKRRQQEDAAEETRKFGEASRRTRAHQRKLSTDEERKAMKEYSQLIEEQDVERERARSRHLPKVPGSWFASADKFDMPKYQQYFSGVERAAEEKRRADEARDAERKKRAKELAKTCRSEIEDQMKQKEERRRVREADDANEREQLENGAAEWNRSLKEHRRRQLEARAEHARALEEQMAASREKEVWEVINGPPPPITPRPSANSDRTL